MKTTLVLNPLTGKMDLVTVPDIVPEGVPSPFDASTGVFPTVTTGVPARWVISVAGTLPVPIGAVEAGGYLLYDGTNFVYIDNPANNYYNEGVNNIAVGGLAPNSGPFNTTIQAMLDVILYPFTQMTGSLGTSPSYLTVREKGVPVSSVTLTATFVNSLNPKYPVTQILFKRAGVTIDTKSGADLTSPQTFVESTPFSDTITFSAEVSSGQPYTVTSSRTFTFVYPMYGGNSDADDYLNWDDLTEVEAVLSVKRTLAKANQTITDTFTNKRNIFMYPASYGDLTSIIDGNGFETISNYDKFTKDITTRDGATVSYNVYQLKNNTSQSIFSNTYKF